MAKTGWGLAVETGEVGSLQYCSELKPAELEVFKSNLVMSGVVC